MRLRSQGRGRLTARVSFDFQAAYDELNPADDDYRFYAALAASRGVSHAVDLSRIAAAGATGPVIALVGAGDGDLADVDGTDDEDEEDDSVAGDDEEDQDSVLALVKSVPGNVSLNSMLTEVRKLQAVRAVGLPAGLFADVAPKAVSGVADAGRSRVAVGWGSPRRRR
jgi:hypothetical protein